MQSIQWQRSVSIEKWGRLRPPRWPHPGFSGSTSTVAVTMITTPRHQIDVVVTEFGAAELSARTVEERTEALIAIAHPSVRAALRAAEPVPLIDADSV